MKAVQYPYHKLSGWFFTLFPGGIILLSIPNLVKFINIHNTFNWSAILVFDLFFALFMCYFMVKKLIPAIQGKIALEINDTGIRSYTKNVSITWADIAAIDLRHTQTSDALYISFKWETDHGSFIRLPLGFIKGRDADIYKTALAYFKANK